LATYADGSTLFSHASNGSSAGLGAGVHADYAVFSDFGTGAGAQLTAAGDYGGLHGARATYGSADYGDFHGARAVYIAPQTKEGTYEVLDGDDYATVEEVVGPAVGGASTRTHAGGLSRQGSIALRGFADADVET
jgi:hypothetical protein